MADMSQRSRRRDYSGPRAVDVGPTSDNGHGNNQRRKEGADSERPGRKRNDSSRPSKPSRRPTVSTHSSHSTDVAEEDSSLELEILIDPAKSVQLGMPVQTCVMVRLRLPTSDRVICANNVDTSRLFGITTLVAENCDGQRVPLEPGLLSGQKMFDSIQPFPALYGTLPYNDPCRVVLGCFTFPDLLIRQAGNYRIRTTLVKMGASVDEGATSLCRVDSEPVKVERRATGTQRRHQRLCN